MSQKNISRLQDRGIKFPILLSYRKDPLAFEVVEKIEDIRDEPFMVINAGPLKLIGLSMIEKIEDAIQYDLVQKEYKKITNVSDTVIYRKFKYLEALLIAYEQSVGIPYVR